MKTLIIGGLLSALLAFLLLQHTKNHEYVIKFGVINKLPSGSNVIEETTTIPLKLKKSGFRYGFTVEEKNNLTFKGYKILYLPAPPKQITGGLKDAEIKNNGEIIRGKTQTYTGRWGNSLYFDKGDPPGDWKIEIYVDDDLIKTVNFKVVPLVKGVGDK